MRFAADDAGLPDDAELGSGIRFLSGMGHPHRTRFIFNTVRR